MSRRPLWVRVAAPGIRAASAALFPSNALGAPDWRSASLVERTIDYMAELPPPQRRLLVSLFAFLQIAPLLFLAAPLPFSWLPVRWRTGIIRRWRASSFFVLKLFGDSVKAALTMQYVSHPEVVRFMGAFKTCARPLDPVPMEVRADFLEKVTA